MFFLSVLFVPRARACVHGREADETRREIGGAGARRHSRPSLWIGDLKSFMSKWSGLMLIYLSLGTLPPLLFPSAAEQPRETQKLGRVG